MINKKHKESNEQSQVSRFKFRIQKVRGLNYKLSKLEMDQFQMIIEEPIIKK